MTTKEDDQTNRPVEGNINRKGKLDLSWRNDEGVQRRVTLDENDIRLLFRIEHMSRPIERRGRIIWDL